MFGNCRGIYENEDLPSNQYSTRNMAEISQQISEAVIVLEPQVTSTDPNERKVARRLRIERRLEALKRQNEPEQVDVEETKDKSLTQIQIETSIEVLKKLTTEGDERVTNIRVASDSRETDHREIDSVNKEKIIESLEEEAQLAEEAFKQISEKWLSILKSNDPLHINEKMMLQKEKCEELVRQKDGIIAILKDEIATAEKKFSLEQKKQVDDIWLLSERIEKQVSLTRRAYREQLKFIEESMEAERKVMMEANSKKWEELYKTRDEDEQIDSNKKYEQMEQFDNQMTDLRREFQEKYRETKIKLERDIDDLELELERIKALAILNSEKLDYNYQILKKREDENIIIKSQQKRRINKLQDIVNTLKRRISEYGKGTKQQIIKVSDEIVKLQKNILEVEVKSDHFAETYDAKFNQLWDMNLERIFKVAERIFTIDKILHEQLLGLEWVDNGILKRKELRKESMPSYKYALEVLEQEAKDQKPQASVNIIKSQRTHHELDEKKEAAREHLLSQLMKQISDRAGFILEDRLQRILEPFLETEKTLIRMDNVFSALNITREADIDELLDYFLPYTHCPMCSTSPAVEGASSMLTEESEVEVEGGMSTDAEGDTRSLSGSEVTHISEDSRRIVEKEKPAHLLIPISHLPGQTITSVMNEVMDPALDEPHTSENDEEPVAIHEILDPLENMPPLRPGIAQKEDITAIAVQSDQPVLEEKLSCQYQHPLIISSVYVLKALRNFVNNYYNPKPSPLTMDQRLSKRRNTICRLIEDEDIKTYWEQFKHLYTEENDNLWNNISDGLKKYHSILKDRKVLHNEVVQLRQQNQEFKLLISKYMDDPNNPNLEPPCPLPSSTPPGTRSRKL